MALVQRQYIPVASLPKMKVFDWETSLICIRTSSIVTEYKTQNTVSKAAAFLTVCCYVF